MSYLKSRLGNYDVGQPEKLTCWKQAVVAVQFGGLGSIRFYICNCVVNGTAHFKNVNNCLRSSISGFGWDGSP
jgi:hypothetical protein